MLARIQRLIVMCLLVGVIGGAAWGAHEGSMALALAVPIVVVVGYTAVLGVEFAWMRSTYDALDPCRPSWRQIARAWSAECSAGPLVFLWWQPFRSRCVPDRLAGDARRGIVFVHGFFCNRGVWTPWLQRLQHEGDRDYATVDLEPVFGPIERYGDAIGNAIQRVRRSTGLAPVVVAHSMGGVAVRCWLAADRRRADAVHRIVTIATPHRGTRLSLFHGERNTGQMASGSRWLAELEAHEDASLRARFVCFWGHCDNIVFPNRHATLDGADNRHLAATPHVRMAFHPDLWPAVMALADAPLPPRAA